MQTRCGIQAKACRLDCTHTVLVPRQPAHPALNRAIPDMSKNKSDKSTVYNGQRNRLVDHSTLT